MWYNTGTMSLYKGRHLYACPLFLCYNTDKREAP